MQTPPKRQSRSRQAALIDERLVEALSHPTRSRALNILSERAASPTEIGHEIGLSGTLVAHHVKKLLELGCVEEVGSRQRRGATERFYRATVRHFFDQQSWAAVPDDDRLGIVMSVVRMISEDLAEGMQYEGFTRDDTHLSRTPMRLDREGWDETVELLANTLEGLLRIREAAGLRLGAGQQADQILASVSILHFEMPPRPAR